MKKILAIVVAIAVFVGLYFLTDQQRNVIDQKINVSSSNANKPVSKISSKNNLTDKESTGSVSDVKKTNLTGSKLEPEIQQALEKMLNTSSEGLVEEKTDKGISVDLKGRFHTVPVATINEKGEVEVQDYSSVPKQGRE